MSALYFQKPENALRRAAQLEEVGDADDAILALHAALNARKFKTQWTPVMEEIILKLIDLCIPLRKLKIMKEGLYQYRAICQQSNVGSLQKVVEVCREKAEAKVDAVKQEVEDAAEETKKLDDLDEVDDPEQILLKAVQADVKRDVDRDVHAWLRSLWEVYKTILDLLKNNAKLEDCYHETARKGFKFCEENQRQLEFKRLCDTLRNHQNSSKASGGYNAENTVNANNPDTIQRMLETRFKQMDVAIKCNLWREAQQTVDDLFSLMQSKASKRGPRPAFISQYYEGLSQIFWNGDNQEFHAAALLKHFSLHKKQSRSFDERAEELANAAVLAVMSIPLNKNLDKTRQMDLEVDHVKERNRKFAQLLKSATVPTRESLRMELVAKDVVAAASAPVQRLYSLIECEFTPLSLCRDAKPLLEDITNDTRFPQLTQYSELLRKVIFMRFAGQLSRVYSSVTMDSFLEMACIVSSAEAEKWLVQASNRNSSEYGAIHAKIDHQNRAIHFSVGDFHSTSIRTQLQTLGIALTVATEKLFPEADLFAQQEVKERIFTDVQKRLDEDHKKVFSRKRLIERRKEQNEKAELVRAQQDREAAEKAEEQRQEQERARQELERKRREAEKADKVRKDAQLKQSMEVLEQIKAQQAAKKDDGDKVAIKVQGKRLEDLAEEDLAGISTDQIEKAKERALLLEKQQKVRDYKKSFKTNDHLARALREEELPLIKKWAGQTAVADKKYLQKVLTDRAKENENEHNMKIAIKKRLLACAGAITAKQDSLMKDRKKEFDRRTREWEERREEFLIDGKVSRAKARYQAAQDREFRMQQEQERMARMKQEEEERRIEEERRARERDEEEARRAEDRANRMAERAKEREEQDRLLQKQLAKEREIEERREREASQAKWDRAKPKDRDNNNNDKKEESSWRRDDAPAVERQTSDKDKGGWRATEMPNRRAGGDRDRDRDRDRGGPAPGRGNSNRDLNESGGGGGAWRATAVPKKKDDADGPSAWRRPDNKPAGDVRKEESGPGAWRRPAPRESPKNDGDNNNAGADGAPAWRNGGGAPRESGDAGGWRSAVSRGKGGDREGSKGKGKGGSDRRGGDRDRDRDGDGKAWRSSRPDSKDEKSNWRDENRGPPTRKGWGDAGGDKKESSSNGNENSQSNGPQAAPLDDDGFATVVKNRRRR
eukprot:gene46-704_t